MKATGFGLSDPGCVRTSNEDFFLIDKDLGLYIVCDGVSGHAAGDTASQLCAKSIRHTIWQNLSVMEQFSEEKSEAHIEKLLQVVKKAIQEANRRIFEMAEADAKKKGMCTTLVMLLFLPDRAILAHVGDSRVYLKRGGKTHLLTTDHNVASDMKKQGAWQPGQGEVSPYGHVLTRAVGFSEFVQPEILPLEVITDDTFILCSDGLTDYVDTEKLNLLLTENPPETVVKNLVEYAKKQGGKDNITVIGIGTESDAPASVALEVLKKSEILQKMPLFRYLNYQELMKLLSIVKIQKLPPGYFLMKEGAQADDMFILVSGKTEILKDGQVVTERTGGDTLGEMGVFDSAPRSASVRTLSDCVAMQLGRAELFGLFKLDAQIAVKFLWSLNQELNARLRDTTKNLAQSRAHQNLTKPTPEIDLPFSLND